MNGQEEVARAETLAKLAHSRDQLRRLLEPERVQAENDGTANGGDRTRARDPFPRSRTMRLLTSSRGLGALAAVGCGLLVSRPALAVRVLRLIPLGAVARILISRLRSANGAKT
jgi:hypothetical protein